MKKRNTKIIWAIVITAVIAIAVYVVCCHKNQIMGGERDEHGCLVAAGYSWCEARQECLRLWEEPCDSILTYREAYDIADNSSCVEKGALSDNKIYNLNTKTWWIDLDMKQEFKKADCNPACVVDEATKTAEINWRCTGLLPP